MGWVSVQAGPVQLKLGSKTWRAHNMQRVASIPVFNVSRAQESNVN